MNNGFRVGPWLIQPSLNTISQNGTSTRLEPKVMEVLVCLSQRAGEAIPKQELLQTVWPDTFVSDDVLKRSISELRRVFKDDAHQSRIIETIPKRGYRLVAHVEPMNGAPVSAANIPTSTDEARKSVVSGRALRFGIAIGTAATALVLVLLGLVPADVWRKLPGKGIVPQIRSVAVLPLKNLSSDPQQKYFAEGMTEELITDLSQISALKVISRTSSEVYEDTHKSLPEIARELNVDAVIEGSVERSGNHVRITAQLIYAPQDKNLWARSYDRDLQDALAVQGTLANAIADEIRVQLSPNEKARLHTPRPVNVIALDYYLQGNYHLHRVRRGSVDEEAHKAAENFQRAIDQDSGFAPAYMGLAYAHAPILFGSGLMNPSPRDYEIRKAAAKKAAALDPDSSATHDLLASIDCEDWNWRDAEEELRRAIALSPNNAEAHDVFGTFLFAMGRGEEGEKEQELAQALDPNVDHLSGSLANLGKDDQAIQLLLRDLERQPDDGQTHFDLFTTYAHAGRYPEAIKQLDEAARLFGFADLAAPLEHTFRNAGFQPAIRFSAQSIEKLQSERKVYMPGVLASFYILVGDKDRAFYWLEDEYRHKHSTGADGGLMWLKATTYAPLRSDPRFKDLLRRVGLPQ